ncbi:hypothetical protein [Bdellovibrio sp. HCB337]|uniref:hypothetical protein n=1 Tax=Bdellovibrio sp. HCB337 TaxID=3394358 RepID=UPI0039A6DAB9
MKNLYKAMAYEHLKVHALALAMLLVIVVVQRTLSVDMVRGSLGFYMWCCLMLYISKPYCYKSWTWLKTLPISRVSLLGLVLAESLIIIPFGLLCSLLTLFLAYPANMPSINNLLSAVSEMMKYILEKPGQGWYYFVLFVIAGSPSLLVVFQPRTAKSFARNNMTRIIITIAAISLVVVVGFYLAPILMATICWGLLFGWFGFFGFKAIFSQRRFQKWAMAYGAIVCLSCYMIVVSRIELSSEKEARPALRMKYYGFLAPNVDRSTLFTLLAKPDLTDESRIEIAKFEQTRTPANKLVSLEDLREWSEKAKSNRVFFQGLSLFQEEIWTSQSLIQLEDELKSRCKDSLQRSKWAAIWRCELSEQLLGYRADSLKLQFKVKEGAELLDVLTPKHPVISSMLIQASLVSSINESWKAKMEALVSSKEPVISDQAQMWLDRLVLNPKGNWDCSKWRSKKDVICAEVDTIGTFGVKIESLTANDPGGSISVSLLSEK